MGSVVTKIDGRSACICGGCLAWHWIVQQVLNFSHSECKNQTPKWHWLASMKMARVLFSQHRVYHTIKMHG